MTPLDDWSREKTGGMTMADWQLKKLRETITLARNSPFNRGRLPTSLPKRLDDIQKLPLMDAAIFELPQAMAYMPEIEPCRDYSPLHQAKRSFTILGG